MARIPTFSFANLTCRFGETFVLTDLLQEVVLPAFFTESHTRRHGFSSYLLRNVGVADVSVDGLDTPQLTIYGRLIKNTLLIRTQVYSPEAGLVADEGWIESAPSSFFALDLNNHKLIFQEETQSAPTLGNFAATLESFIRRELDSYIRALHALSQQTEEPKTFRQLRDEFPPPEVEITPLATAGTVSSFIEAFSILERAEFKLLSTNLETPQGNNFELIRAMKDGARADTTRLIHENKKGLNKEEITREATEAAESGNQKVLLRGLGEDGAVLKGSNEDLKLQVRIPDLPDNLLERAAVAVRTYLAQVFSGRLRPDNGAPPMAKLNPVKEALGERVERR
jgi:hypothetical protein